MRSIVSTLAFMFLVGPAVAADLTDAQIETAKKEVLGPWKLEFTTPDYVERTPTVLIGRHYRELVAWYVEEDKPQAFKTVQLEDDALVLTIRPDEPSDVTVTIKATLKAEGQCVGEGSYVTDDGDSGSWELKGKRVSPADFDEMQRWQLDFVSPDYEQHKAVVTVVSKDGQLYGWYTSKDHDLPATKVTVNGDIVSLSVTAKTREGDSVDVSFRGTVSGDRVTGTAEYDLDGDTGSFSFKGQRKS